MGKPQNARREADNEAKAIARTIRVSPQKLNLVAATIRGQKVEKALNDLAFSRKRIAETVRKTLESAIANAENNHDLDVGQPRRRGSARGQVDPDEAFPRPRARPVQPDRQAVLAPDDHRA